MLGVFASVHSRDKAYRTGEGAVGEYVSPGHGNAIAHFEQKTDDFKVSFGRLQMVGCQ